MKNPFPAASCGMPATEDKVGLKETQIREKVADGGFSQACPALGFRPRHRLP